MWKEFKKFALKGNVLDLAVGVIIGGAFNKIVSSLVGDIIMPLLIALTGYVDIKEATIPVGSATLKYGMFIQNILDFIIIAFSVFIMVKAINKFTSFRKAEEKKEVIAKLTKDQELLIEIKNLLAENLEQKNK